MGIPLAGVIYVLVIGALGNRLTRRPPTIQSVVHRWVINFGVGLAIVILLFSLIS